MSRVPTAVLWFRRDLRLADNPALLAALDDGDVLPLYVHDPRLSPAGGPRRARLEAALAGLSAATGGALVVRAGDPRVIVPRMAAEVAASRVHVARATTPDGRRRDELVRRALESDGRWLVATGTPYAVDPGSVLTAGGTPYRVFTRYAQAWRAHGWLPPAPQPDEVAWRTVVATEPAHRGSGGQHWEPVAGSGSNWAAGAAGALARWRAFRADGAAGYDADRDRPDLDVTSRMSVPLCHGEIHPRTMLADLAGVPGAGAARYQAQLCWREFFADVLWHDPDSAWHDLRGELAAMEYDSGPEVDAAVQAWQAGRTGFPFVDAGMRQLRAEGWMHNRVRMVTASFLVKDLHVWWPVGARHFLELLLDGDLASNSHGWQWVAGTGTDAAPYFRVFNPVTQGLRFDPGGEYVRRWIPELAHLRGPAAHEPWRHAGGYDHGYPQRIVDHAFERSEALERHRRARAATR
ncbi:MAG: deoxyribodipyrimidine photo-lyase [Candidatus Nanopelagicales bacterium]